MRGTAGGLSNEGAKFNKPGQMGPSTRFLYNEKMMCINNWKYIHSEK